MMAIPDVEELSRSALVALVQEVRAALAVVRDQMGELTAALAAAHARISELEGDLEALRDRGGRGGGPIKTPENSSVPSGKSWKAQRAQRGPSDAPPAKRGPKVGHRGASRERAPSEQVETVLTCRPQQCRSCGGTLPMVGGTVVGRRQVLDLPPIQPVVTEAQLVAVRCSDCQVVTVGAYPVGFGATGTFGPRVTALAALLHEEHHVAYARLSALFGDAFGVRISEGTLVAAVGRLGAALAPAAAAIGEQVRASPVVGSDETGARVDGATWWEWVFQTATAAYHTIVRRRNTAVVLSFLNGAVPQVWVSDLWKPQLAAPAVRYQICLAHQLRDLEYARQGGHGLAREWACAMDAALRWTIRLFHQREQTALSPPDLDAQIAAIHRAMARLLGQPLPPSWSGDLQARFRVHRAGMLTCLDDPMVPPTNNASERSLRPGVVHRKVTGGFRSERAAHGYAAIRTVADTARKRGQNLFALFLDAAHAILPETTCHIATSTT